jgi:hypothetical protein
LARPAHLVTITNQLFQHLFGNRTLARLRLRESLPDLVHQPFFALIEEVYRTGTTGYGYQVGLFRVRPPIIRPTRAILPL